MVRIVGLLIVLVAHLAAADVVYEPIQLRGYGVVAGARADVDAPSGRVSILRIRCDDAAAARVLRAKFVSDLHRLSGVEEQRITLGGQVIPVVIATGQGCLAAGRLGREVHILALEDPADLGWMLAREPGLGDAVWDEAAVVPMALDRWDGIGLRTYWLPWRQPRGVARNAYDYLADFAFLREHQVGCLFWCPPSPLNTAEGMLYASFFEWGVQAATAAGLPFGFNLSTSAGAEARWLVNRFPEQIQMRMPQFCGSQHAIASPYMEAKGVLSWASREGHDTFLGVMQAALRDIVDEPGLVSINEPHGELYHGEQDILLEYGPVADASFRRYLRATHGDLEALSRRWYGEPGSIASWDAVRVPELASFLGWNERAIDLTGSWAVGHEAMADGHEPPRWDTERFGYHRPIPTVPAPAAWVQPDFDDSTWPRVDAPGSDRSMFLPKRPAIYRRDITVDANALAAHPRWWLYVWDLSQASNDVIRAWVNGRAVGSSRVRHPSPHWAAFPVEGALVPGANQISLRLPAGRFGYRVYLSPDEPKQYPRLGAGRNARWVDLCLWNMQLRLDRVERGMSMIRGVDPDRQITLMAPSHYADGVIGLAESYGGAFKDTGFMGIGYFDLRPGLMRGAGLPFTVEPGSPPEDLRAFRFAMGSYLTSGVQGVDYYQHQGHLLWRDDIRSEFETHAGLYRLFGKFHAPRGDFAVLYGTRAGIFTNFPWTNDPNAGLRSGYFAWNVAAGLRGAFEYDALSESAFARGHADRYRVVLDSNTVIMDEALAAEIEAWVRAGGIFITSGQTGRHTPLEPDAWPISALSGYEVARIDRHDAHGAAIEGQRLVAAPGQAALAAWDGREANGLGLRAATDGCTDLLRWADGSVAVGARRLGAGMIVHTGVKFGRASLPDRIEWARESGRADEVLDLGAFYGDILGSLDVPAARMECAADAVYCRHFVSNNGLHDVWVVWSQNDEAVSVDLRLRGAVPAVVATDVSTGEGLAVARGEDAAVVAGVALEAHQTRAFLTPRGRITDAPAEWFALQREWWRGTRSPVEQNLPTPDAIQRCAHDLGQDWAFVPLADEVDAAAVAAVDADDAAWERRDLGIWSVDHPDLARGIFRKTFTVPEDWVGGEVSLWLQSHNYTTVYDRADLWLDGRRIIHDDADGVRGWHSPELVAGSRHTLAIDVRRTGHVGGVAGECWLTWTPEPVATIDLAGTWSLSQDALHDHGTLIVPGDGDGFLFERSIEIGAEHAGRSVVVRCVGSPELNGVLINGRWLRQDHHPIAGEWFVDITPWVVFGGENRIGIARMRQPGRFRVEHLSLDLYPEGAPHP